MDIKLAKGSHPTPDDGLCFMEAVAYVAGEGHSSRPKCASPVLGQFLRRFNDCLADEPRQRLTPYITRVIGTANDGHDKIRIMLCEEWLLNTAIPAWESLPRNPKHTSFNLGAEIARHAAIRSTYPAASVADAPRWLLFDIEDAAVTAGKFLWSETPSPNENLVRDALRPTVEFLNESTFELLDKMVS